MAEFDNLREEFDNFMKNQQEACDTGCDLEEDAEEYPDYIVELIKTMMVPQKCGVYFSKKDIQFIGRNFGELIGLKPRERMLKDLLTSFLEPEEMQKMFQNIKDLVDIKVATYDELADNFQHSMPFFNTHKQKALRFKKRLDEIHRDYEALKKAADL